jgi:hypothetical protein
MNVYCDQCCGVLVAYWAYRYLSVLVSPGALWIPRRRSKSHSNSPASTAIGSSRLSSPALYVRYLITQITLLEKRMSERKLSNCNEHAHSHSHGQSLSLSLFDSSSTFNHITSCQTTRYPLDIDNVCSVVRYYSLTVKHKGAVDVI